MPVYQYEGQHYDLPDGLSNEQAIAKIQTHLGTATKKPTVEELWKPIEQGAENWQQNLQGVAEAGASLASGAYGMLTAPFTAFQTPDAKNAEEAYSKAIERVTYEPRTEKGKEITGRVGEAINRYVLPAAVGVQGLPYVNTLAPLASTFGKTMKRVGKVAEAEKPANSLRAELNGEIPAPVPTENFAPVVAEKGLKPEQPMQRMATELGAEQFAPAEEFSPMSQMAQQLPDFEMESRARAVQDVVDRRQAEMEFEVKRQGTQDRMAAELQRNEAAPTGYKEWQQAKDTEEQQARLKQDTEMALRAGQGEQGQLFEPHMNMHRAYDDIKAATETGSRPFSLKEFTQTIESLAKEPGTAFKMPEDIPAAYDTYLQHVSKDQPGLFEAHKTLQATADKPWEKLTKEEQTAAKAALDVVNPAKKEPVFSIKRTENEKGKPVWNVLRDGEVLDAFSKKSEASSWIEKAKKPQSPFEGVQEFRAGFTKEDMTGIFKGIPGLADNIKDIGYAGIRTPDEAIQLAQGAKDVSQNMVQKAANLLTKGGLFLKAKLNNPVIHFTVDKFLQADRLAHAEVSQKVHTDYVQALRDLSKEDRVSAFELLNAADLNQKTITPEMMQRHGLSTELQSFIMKHQALMNDVLVQINKAREATGKKPITAREAYSAMSMTGDFRKVVYKMVDGKQEVVGVIGSNTKNIGKQSLKALEDKVLEKDPSLSFGPLQDMSKTSRSARGTPHEAFLDVLETLGEDNPHIAEFIQTLKDVSKDDPANYLGMHKHTMQKKGVFGMEGRKPWLSTEQNATAFFENQVRYAESALTWGHLAEAAKDVNEVIRHPDVVVKQDNAVRLSEQYMQNALGINPSRMGRAVSDMFNTILAPMGVGPSIGRNVLSMSRATANTSMLSLNPVFLGIQAIQAPSVLPGITAMLRGRGLAPSSTWLSQGLGHFAEGGYTLMKDMLGKDLTPVERGALDYAKKNHVYATDMVEHANQTEKGLAFYTTKVTQTPAALVEQATRAQAYMALVHMMHDAGLTPKQGLYEQAAHFTDLAMVNYSALEKPPIYNALGPIGSMAYNLKSYGHHQISLWSMMAREIANTGNPAPLLTQMAVTIAMAGVMGLPFFSQWETLYDFITTKLGHPRSLALDVMDASKVVGKHLGDKGAFALSHGAPALLGMDLSKRIGLGDVLPSSAADVGFAGGGKLWEAGKAVGRAAVSPSEENLKAAAMNVAPPIAQGPLDVAWYQKGNLAYSKDPTNLRPLVRRTEADILLKKLGITGIHESTTKEAKYRQDVLDKAYAEYRTQAMRTIAQDLFRNRPVDPKTIDKYFKTGQGDPATFERDLQRMAIEQNMSPDEALLLKQSATQRIPQLQSMMRRAQ